MHKWDSYRPKLVEGKRVASSEYRSWQMMKNRCLNPKAGDYRHYGGRGIGIDECWLEFDNFMDDMGQKPAPEYTLDRIRGGENYGPGNCRWATKEEQSRNREYCALIRGYHTWELADLLGVKLSTVHHRIWKTKSGEIQPGALFSLPKGGRYGNRRRYL